jgi:riboflavin kinase / FMN adenylyltransferase
LIEVKSLKLLREHGVTNVTLACGNFDGLHVGHRKIIQTLLDKSIETSSTPVVLTFSPHPREVLLGEKIPTLASSLMKSQILSELGVVALVSIPFTLEFSRKTALEFVNQELLESGLTIEAVCIGSEWRFGAGREGDTEFLRSGPWNFLVISVPEVTDEFGHISSSRIRHSLSASDFITAEKLLGRPYSIIGPVIHGAGIAARELDYPTANLDVGEQYLPLSGVFACKAKFIGGVEKFGAVCNIGVAPTFNEVTSPVKVEIHILDFSKEIYDDLLELEFIAFIRNEMKFDSSEQLKEQISLDVARARKILSSVSLS